MMARDPNFPKWYQHSVSRFYLDGFTNKDGHLFVYPKATMRPFRSGPRKVSGEAYFYDYPHNLVLYMEEEDKHFLEDRFNDFETKFSIAMSSFLKKLQNDDGLIVRNAGKRTLSHNERGWLSWFVALQWMRTKEARRLILQIKRLKSKQDPSQSFEEDMAGLYQGEVIFDPAMPTFVQLLECGEWRIGLNTTDMPFYTSDTPVVACGIRDGERCRTLFDLFSSFDRLYLPLSPWIMLTIYSPRRFKVGHRRANRTELVSRHSQITAYNSLQVLHSLHEVYSGSRDFSVADQVCREHPFVRRADTLMIVAPDPDDDTLRPPIPT
jgi:hypothetical protein